MRVLLVSYLFDVQAEGICTGRLARALLNEGVQLTVITSHEGRSTLQHENLNFCQVSAPRLPVRLVSLINRVYRTPESNVPWYWNVMNATAKLGAYDLVYGRSFPISGLHVARDLAKRLKSCFWVHYSDPIPNPWEPPASSMYRRQVTFSEELLGAAQAATFTTAEGLRFQEASLQTSLSGKGFVLPHIAPPPAILEWVAKPFPNFVYLGTFYRQRTAHELLKGFAAYLLHSPGASITFVGSAPESVYPIAQELGISSGVRVADPVQDVTPCMAAADILVGLDSSCGTPVFMTTKLVEYLMVNRRVLMVTPSDSPADKLLSRFPATCISVRENAESIAQGMQASSNQNPRHGDYEQRFALMEEFSPKSVSQKFLAEFARRHPHPTPS